MLFLHCLRVWSELDYSPIKVAVMTWLKLNQTSAVAAAQVTNTNPQNTNTNTQIHKSKLVETQSNQSSSGRLKTKFEPFDTSHKLQLICEGRSISSFAQVYTTIFWWSPQDHIFSKILNRPGFVRWKLKFKMSIWKTLKPISPHFFAALI